MLKYCIYLHKHILEEFLKYKTVLAKFKTKIQLIKN